MEYCLGNGLELLSASVISTINKKPPSSTVPPPEELVSMFFKCVDPSDTHKGFACLPYISGLTEPHKITP